MSTLIHSSIRLIRVNLDRNLALPGPFIAILDALLHYHSLLRGTLSVRTGEVAEDGVCIFQAVPDHLFGDAFTAILVSNCF